MANEQTEKLRSRKPYTCERSRGRGAIVRKMIWPDASDILEKINVTVDSWFSTWMEEYKRHQVKLTTYELYEQTYEGHIKPYIQKKKLRDIRPEHIQRTLNAESKVVKRQTLTRIHIILNGLFW